jgi:hypothetical protein
MEHRVLDFANSVHQNEVTVRIFSYIRERGLLRKIERGPERPNCGFQEPPFGTSYTNHYLTGFEGLKPCNHRPVINEDSDVPEIKPWTEANKICELDE